MKSKSDTVASSEFESPTTPVQSQPEETSNWLGSQFHLMVDKYGQWEKRLKDNWLVALMMTLFTLFAAVATCVGFAVDLPELLGVLPPPPELMTGEFNVAVAEFEVSGSPEYLPENAGSMMAQQVFTRLDGYLTEAAGETDIIFEVWSPQKVGAVEGETREERELAAAALAAQIGADMVVYGLTKEDDATQTVEPQFYVSERLFSTIPEMLGKHPLGGVIDLAGAGDLAGRIAANRLIAARLRALSLIAVGLSFYQLGEYQQALDTLILASTVEGWNKGPGNESIYLMLGNAAAKLERLDEAQGYFSEALSVNSEYARAYIGLGNTNFRRALGVPLHQSYDLISGRDLDEAEAAYTAALAADDQPLSADIDAKAYFGLGRLELVRYQKWGDREYDLAAQDHFRAVISDHEAGNSRMTELAALSHGYLGTLAIVAGRPDEVESEFAAAIEETSSRVAKAGFLAQLGDFRASQGDLAGAIAAYEQAVDVAPDSDSRASYRARLDDLRDGDSVGREE